jgi:hypothetical protein
VVAEWAVINLSRVARISLFDKVMFEISKRLRERVIWTSMG